MDWYIESMDEMRRLQKVGYSTLSLSIPSGFAKDLGLRAGDNMLVREEADGTLRLIPAVSAKRVSRATIRTDQLDGEDLIPKLIIGCYALGYDTIEVGPSAEERWTAMVDHWAEKPPSFGKSSYYFGANIPGKPRRYLLNSGGRPKLHKEIGRVVETDYAAFRLTRPASRAPEGDAA